MNTKILKKALFYTMMLIMVLCIIAYLAEYHDNILVALITLVMVITAFFEFAFLIYTLIKGYFEE